MIGEWVVALGNPFAYLLGNAEPTVTAGVVSATGRNILPSQDQAGLYLDMIQTGAFSHGDRALFAPIVSALLDGGDPYFLLADYAAYVASQERVAESYRDRSGWTRASILNCANMGRFSSDRTIREYADEIWGVRPVSIQAHPGA